ncbi:MAG: glucosamine--fructose-6-phosphate aminotransferase (isomerizing) [Lentisphaeria bacterium]|jgi:glucosamine--fructose-6-phosphate aminotransferase (isomerizing)
MCGIVGAVSERNVIKILIEGLRRLEYRGYDSAGVAIIDNAGALLLNRAVGKVQELADLVERSPMSGGTGIAHTRWATHGVPNEANAHPHISGNITVVHNGIIENYKALKEELQAQGYTFNSDTDTETIAHLLHLNYASTGDLFTALQLTIKKLKGAYGLSVVCADNPELLLGTRSGSPLVIGLGIDENFLASDPLALRQITDKFIYLEEGDVVRLKKDSVEIFDVDFNPITRKEVTISDTSDAADKGEYRHYMLKEIYEQPQAIANTLEGRLGATTVLEEIFGAGAGEMLAKVENVQIVACGTSYHAGLIAKFAIEDWAGIPCLVDIASEYRYRKVITPKNALFVSISQSGETADTLAALRKAKSSGYLSAMTICNVANSSLVRESEFRLMTRAGSEIGVASTKAFTTQIVALQILALALGKTRGLSTEKEHELVLALKQLPSICEKVLALDEAIEKISEHFVEKHHALFLGRGVQYPVAMEGALKLKEISYIHAEAYPAGELKHGPLALVDSDMPVITVAPSNELLEKLKSNLEEVQARGGKLYVFADHDAGFTADENTVVFNVPHVPPCLEALVYTLPLQLLSYHVAVMRGTDVDQPRNLAKSVTVE